MITEKQLDVLEAFYPNKALTANQVSKSLNIGVASIYSRLQILVNLNYLIVGYEELGNRIPRQGTPKPRKFYNLTASGMRALHTRMAAKEALTTILEES